MRKIILVIITLLQVFSIIYLVGNISKREKVISVAELSVEGVSIEEAPGLIYFYTNKKDKVEVNEEFWLDKIPRQTITSEGFNERFVYNSKKPRNTRRIMTVGDSFTYGLYVDTKDNYPEQLEDLLNDNCKKTVNYEVINAGVRGYDAEYVVELYRQYGRFYNPDVTVWLLNQAFTKVNEVIIPRVEECNKKLPGDADSIMLEDGTIKYGCNSFLIKGGNTEEDRQYQIKKTENFLNTVENDWVMIYDSVYTDNDTIKYFEEKTGEYSNLYLFKTSLEFLPGNSNSFPDGHPNEQGHRLLAEEIFKYLIEEKLVSC